MSDCFLRIVPRCAPQARPKNGISGYVVRSEGRGPGVGWGGGVFRGGWGPNVSIPGILGTGTLCETALLELKTLQSLGNDQSGYTHNRFLV